MSRSMVTTTDDAPDVVGEDIDTLMNLPINRDGVIRLGDTLMGIHPQAKEIGLVGMRTVAQLALATGANPLPGTNGIHAWIDNKGKLCVQFGIAFLRSLVEVSGGYSWEIRPRAMTKEEREELGVLDGDMAVICSGALNRDMKRVAETIKAAGLPPLSWQELKAGVAQRGYGIVSSEKWSNSGGYKNTKAGRSLAWSAELAAERDMLRRLVPISSITEMRQANQMKPPAWEREIMPERKAIAQNYSADDFNEQMLATPSQPIILDAEIEEEGETFWETAVKSAQTVDALALAAYQYLSGAKIHFDSAVEVKTLLALYCPHVVESEAMAEAVRAYIEAVADRVAEEKALAHTRYDYLSKVQAKGHQLLMRGNAHNVSCILSKLIDNEGRLLYEVVVDGKTYKIDQARVLVDPNPASE